MTHSSDVQNAIEHNAEIICITLFVSIDITLTNFLLNHAITIQPDFNSIMTVRSTNYYAYTLIDRQLLNALLIGKSLLLYMSVFAIASRLPER